VPVTKDLSLTQNKLDVKQNVPQIFRNDTGRPSGISLPDGRTFLGLSADEVEKVAAGELAKKGGAATQQFEAEGKVQAEQQAQQQLIKQNQALAGQIKEVPPLDERIEAEPLRVGEAFQESTGQIIGQGIKFATGGAAAGALVGAPTGVGAPVGAIIGGVGGFVAGVYSAITSNLKEQKTEGINNQKAVLASGKTHLKKLVNLAKVDPANADVYVTAFNRQMAKIAEAHSKLNAESRVRFNWLDVKTSEALQDYENFYSEGGLADSYTAQMQLNLIRGAGKADPAALALLQEMEMGELE
jgi:hypothetical protein